MRERWKRYWPILKVVITLAVVAAVGRQFARDLGRLDQLGTPDRPFHWGWLIGAGLLYLVGIGFCAVFWDRLLRRYGERPTVIGMLRAYYVGHLGKYSPGKAWALLLRVALARSDGVRVGVAAMTCMYEVLTTMAAGVLLAALLFLLLAPPATAGIDWSALGQVILLQVPEEPLLDRWLLAALALLLLLPLGVAITPSVYNRLAQRAARPFHKKDHSRLPRLDWSDLLEGLLITGVGWFFLAGSLLAVFHAIMPNPPPWDARTLGLYAAYLATAYVAGFLVLIVPGGLGVREFFLTLFLVPELARLPGGEDNRAYVVLAVVLLRLVWTAAEVPAAGLLYLLPRRAPDPADSPLVEGTLASSAPREDQGKDPL